jgi:hypothetical protein
MKMELCRRWRVEKWTCSHPEFIMPARRVTLRIQPPNPFGEVTMVPATLSGRPEADAARAMAAAFADSEEHRAPTCSTGSATPFRLRH